MKRILFPAAQLLALILMTSSCNQQCVDNVLLQTIRMDFEVNTENFGILNGQAMNVTDTIHSETRQFYMYPQLRRFGQLQRPAFSLISTAYASGDCLEKQEYISRMDPEQTKFSIDRDYDASSVGEGVLPAGYNLMAADTLRNGYLKWLRENLYLNAGAPIPVTILKEFFEQLEDETVTFYFHFEEIDGTVFEDSVQAYVDLIF